MGQRSSTVRAIAIAATLATVAVPLTFASPANATPSANGTATSSVTFLLAANDPAALTRLAAGRKSTHHQRTGELTAAEPTEATRAQVITILTSRGLHVVRQTMWSITASGAPAQVQSLMGSLKKKRAQQGLFGSRGQLTATGIPQLQGLITGAVGGDDTTPIVHPLYATPQTGTQLRELYQAPVGAPIAGAPALTVATLQFSGWNSADLTSYAKYMGVADPVATGAYQAIGIGGASPSTADGGGGEGEVALDQESLLAIAPFAKQRAYFAQNNPQGFVDALEQIATDASDTTHNGYNLAALSISWGACETDWGNAMDPVHTAIQHVLAAGVSVFASSGDSGTHDCASDPNAVGVDYPASDPGVVGVGGTTVDSNKSQTGWPGSGGGSSMWAHPAYQSGTANRQVPDIAADADPDSGVAIISGGQPYLAGGTSLSSPLSAGMFTNTLAARGYPFGIGNILPDLYAAPDSAFTDITTGNNGGDAAVGYDTVTGRGTPVWSSLVNTYAPLTLVVPPAARSGTIPVRVNVPSGLSLTAWRAGTGAPPRSCDSSAATSVQPTSVTLAASATGHANVWALGFTTDGTCYLAGAAVIVDNEAPRVGISATLLRPTASTLNFRWNGGDFSSGLSHFAVTIAHSGSAVPDYQIANTTVTNRVMAGVPGRTYTLAVISFDRAGNASSAVGVKVAVPLDERSFAFRGRWTHGRTAAGYAGSLSKSTGVGATAAVRATGASYVLLATTCPTCGQAAVYIDGHKVRTIDLYSAVTNYRARIGLATLRSTTHAVVIKVLHTHNRRSHGSAVILDGLIATR